MNTWINILLGTLLLSILGSTVFTSKAINLTKNYLNNISNSQYNIDPTYPQLLKINKLGPIHNEFVEMEEPVIRIVTPEQFHLIENNMLMIEIHLKKLF